MRIRALTAVTAIVLFLVGCGQKATNESAQATESAMPVKGIDRSHSGSPLPALKIDDPSGNISKLPISGDKPMLVNLWASWCGPCVKELPTLQALSQRPGAPKIIEVSENMGPRASVDAFLKQHGIDKLKSWHDPNAALTGALDAQVLPTTIYYDGQGHEVWRYVGDLDWTGPEAAKLLGGSVRQAG